MSCSAALYRGNYLWILVWARRSPIVFGQLGASLWKIYNASDIVERILVNCKLMSYSSWVIECFEEKIGDKWSNDGALLKIFISNGLDRFRRQVKWNPGSDFGEFFAHSDSNYGLEKCWESIPISKIFSTYIPALTF